MALLTYQDARPWARAIKDKVVSHQMPPWFADPTIGSFANDPSLTAGEIATIAKWVDGGAPQGDLKDMPKAPQFVEGWQLGEPDMIVELPEIQIPATGGDYFPTPNLALPLTEDRWIRAVEIRPGNREVTHHSVIFSANVGAAMNAGSGAINPSGVFDVLAVWAVGTAPTVYPEGTGRWVRKGQTLHQPALPPERQAQVDRTRVGLYFGKGELKKEVAASLAGNINFTIPPQARNYEMRAAYVADQDINIVSFFPHMHLRGSDMTMTATYPGGRQETLLNVPAYDFNWQLFYYPKTTVRLPKGTRIDLVAHYDNSSANKRNPDPNRSVGFGEASTAEMMFGMFEFTAADGVSPKRPRLATAFRSCARRSPTRPTSSISSCRTRPFRRCCTSPARARARGTCRRSGSSSSRRSSTVWTGKTFAFEGVLHVGAGPGDPPFTVKGERLDDGSIKATVEPLDNGRIPFKEFTGSTK